MSLAERSSTQPFMGAIPPSESLASESLAALPVARPANMPVQSLEPVGVAELLSDLLGGVADGLRAVLGRDGQPSRLLLSLVWLLPAVVGLSAVLGLTV